MTPRLTHDMQDVKAAQLAEAGSRTIRAGSPMLAERLQLETGPQDQGPSQLKTRQGRAGKVRRAAAGNRSSPTRPEAKLRRQVPPRDPSVQRKQDPLQRGPIVQPLTARIAKTTLPPGQQGLHSLPQRIGDDPRRDSHRHPRLDGRCDRLRRQGTGPFRMRARIERVGMLKAF